MEKILLYFAIKYNGEWDKIYRALREKEQIAKEDLNKEINDVKHDYITILDDEYPQGFKEVYKPPFVLFYKGNKNILKSKNILALVDGENYEAEDVLFLVDRNVSSKNKQIIVTDDINSTKSEEDKIYITEFYSRRLMKDSEYAHLLARTVVGLSDKIIAEHNSNYASSEIIEYASEKNKLILLNN